MAEPYRLLVATDGAELWQRIEAAHARFGALVREVDPALRLPHSSWTVRDVVGHLLTVGRRYTRRDITSDRGLAEEARGVDRLNEEQLAELGDATCAQLLDELEVQLKEVAAAWPAGTLDLHTAFPFHGGVRVDAAAGMSNLIGEFLVHGLDVARAAGRSWRIDGRDALLILNGVVQILPAYAKRSATQSLTLRLRMHGARDWTLAFSGGRCESRPAEPGERVDAVVRVPAETLMLALYARLTPLAALRRRMLVVGGRRPWRVTRLSRLLEQP